MQLLVSSEGSLLPGFPDPVLDSQRVFRAVLQAMSRPGRAVSNPVSVHPPKPLNATTAALCLTLLDLETAVWLQPDATRPNVVEYLRFHCGCPLAPEADKAAFALITEAAEMPPLDRFPYGDAEYPERGATIIVQVDGLLEGSGPKLTGPGIETSRRVDAVGLPSWFWPALGESSGRFPTGVDILLTTEDAMVGLPRSLRLEV